jgi:hypothetical protein
MNAHDPRGLQYGPEKQRVADPSHTQPPDFSPSSVEIRIEELALHGFTPIDRYRLAAAVERELARLFTDQGVPTSLAQGNEIAHLNGGRFEVAAGANAEGIGIQVAQALYGGLTR